jgi:hypothetical protein
MSARRLDHNGATTPTDRIGWVLDVSARLLARTGVAAVCVCSVSPLGHSCDVAGHR